MRQVDCRKSDVFFMLKRYFSNWVKEAGIKALGQGLYRGETARGDVDEVS
jgi:hypothetical protein